MIFRRTWSSDRKCRSVSRCSGVFRVPRQIFELKPRGYNTYLLPGGRVQVCIYTISGTRRKLSCRYRLRSSLTEENANLIFVRCNNSVQDMVPRVIENGCIVCELCATQDRMIGATDVIETYLRYIQLQGPLSFLRLRRLRGHESTRGTQGRPDRA